MKPVTVTIDVPQHREAVYDFLDEQLGAPKAGDAGT
jgi:hypothetical protein